MGRFVVVLWVVTVFSLRCSPMFIFRTWAGAGDLERARERATQQFVPGSRESAVREECQHMGTVCCNGTSLGRLYFAVFRA